jgi:putative Holliday junction resolvase
MTNALLARVVGLDVGDVRVGVAVSDDLGITAQPRDVLGHDHQAVANLIARVGAVRLVVGLPLDPRGEEGRQARKVRRFLERLEPLLPDGVTVEMWDERFSTAQAERALIEGGVRRGRRKQVVDMVSAALILQSWLEANS